MQLTKYNEEEDEAKQEEGDEECVKAAIANNKWCQPVVAMSEHWKMQYGWKKWRVQRVSILGIFLLGRRAFERTSTRMLKSDEYNLRRPCS